MTTIGDLFERPIDRPIEEVIKVDQANERAVVTEIDEYVATDSIRRQFAEVYKEIAEAPAAPREGIGVWISGFFGAGKSSFAKILGYTVANRRVGNTTASALFKRVLNDTRADAYLDSINARIPFEAVIFDVSMDRGIRTSSERLTEIMYRALLRELGYAEDFDLAELEITLEADGRLDGFERAFEVMHGEPWRKRRQMGLAINEASAVLNKLAPEVYATADSWAIATGEGRADVDPNRLARRAFELANRRAQGRALIFIVDEVGQFVSRSVDKMLDLQAIVQAFGVEGRNRTERREAVSPFWIVVTSQEKLNEVVTALDSKRVELARLQDRFRVTVDLKQSDIAEVTARRVLGKSVAATQALGKLYADNAGRIKETCTLENTARNLEITKGEFVRLYPYLPYQIELCIDIVAGLRLKRGAHRHVGGSNRTIIKQAQQMMINDRTRLADEAVGTLVTLDRVYELLEVGNLLPTEVNQEIVNVSTRLAGNPMAVKVMKAIALLESVRDLPRTAHNLAVVLHPNVTAGPIVKDVEAALAELEKAQFVRKTEEGYKLLTVQEKNWETKRNGLEPREADRHRIQREMVADIFGDPKVRVHSYKNLRSFKLKVSLNGETVEGDGDLALNLRLGEPAEIKAALDEARQESAASAHDIFWVAELPAVLRDGVSELYRSREMVAEYERLAAQQRLGSEEGACLADEKTRRDKFQRTVRGATVEAIESGHTFLQGVARPATGAGTSLSEMLGGLVQLAIPIAFPKMETGVLPLSGQEAETFLTAASLTGLPKVFYDDRAELSLVTKQGGQYVPNLGCQLCRQIVEYVRREHQFGNRVTGKMLESHFGGLGYGWTLESTKLGVAILFRGGALELSHQGRKYSHYTEPTARQPFQSTPAFRAASFSPRQALDIKVLVKAARTYEELTGREVNVEEGEIAQALKQAAAEDKEKLVPLAARFAALRLPGLSLVQEQLKWVEGILESPPDDCVKTLAFEGKTYLDNRGVVEEMSRAATDGNVEEIALARRTLGEQWPLLEERGANGKLEKAATELKELLGSDDCLRRIETVKSLAETLGGAYRAAYAAAFKRRGEAYLQALDTVKGRVEWVSVSGNPDIPPESKAAVTRAIESRAVTEPELPRGATVCAKTRATLGQLESETEAVEAVTAQALRKLLEQAAPDDRVERVAVAKLFPSRIANDDELKIFIAALREHLEKILSLHGTIILE